MVVQPQGVPHLFKTSNPALNQKIFTDGDHVSADEAMTLDGTVNKTWILLFCLAASASYPWRVFNQTHSAAAVQPIVALGAFGGLIFAMITIFKKSWAPVTAPIYALLEGLALGGLSALLEVRYPGIAIQSVAMTLGTLLVCASAGLPLRPDTGVAAKIPRSSAASLQLPAQSLCSTSARFSSASSASTSPPSTAQARSASHSAWLSWSWPRSI